MLAESHVRRFSRHVLLREVGGRGQLRLLEASITLPALDAPHREAALWLARSGVGTLVIPDDRTPAPGADVSGLLHASDAGRPLVDAVSERLREHFPDVKLLVGEAPGPRVEGAAGALDAVRALLEAA